MGDTEKLNTIKAILNKRNSVKVNTLAEELGVTMITVRRYLAKLEKEGFLTKTHGGAVLNNHEFNYTNVKNKNDDMFIKDVNISNVQYKEQTAELATSLVDHTDSLFIGGGTTCYLFAKKLKAFKGVTIVTTCLNTAYELYPYVKNIYFIGGELISNNGVFYTGGPKIAAELGKVYVNKSFISIGGIDLNAGLTTHELSQLSMMHSIKKISKQTIILADHTKFGFLCAHQAGTIDMADVIITDTSIDSKYSEAFKKSNVKLLTV